MNKLVLLMPIILSACSFSPREAKDLELYETYSMIKHKETEECSVKVENIVTTMQMGPLAISLKEAGAPYEAVICGELNCPGQPPRYQCVQSDLLMQQ